MISFLSRTIDFFFFFLSLWIYLWLAETSQQPISQTTWLKVTPNCNHCNHWCVAWAVASFSRGKGGDVKHTFMGGLDIAHTCNPCLSLKLVPWFVVTSFLGNCLQVGKRKGDPGKNERSKHGSKHKKPKCDTMKVSLRCNLIAEMNNTPSFLKVCKGVAIRRMQATVKHVVPKVLCWSREFKKDSQLLYTVQHTCHYTLLPGTSHHKQNLLQLKTVYAHLHPFLRRWHVYTRTIQHACAHHRVHLPFCYPLEHLQSVK